MLRAAHPHPAQACLAFANPPPAETKFATRLHAAQLPSLDVGDKATFNYLRNKYFKLMIKFIRAKTCIFTGKRLATRQSGGTNP